jgi:hypothetical protein
MESVSLPGTGRASTRLGFGSVKLFGGPARRASLRLLGAAHEAGIPYFDVKPSDGLGAAEAVLGGFRQRRRGMMPRQSSRWVSWPFGRGAASLILDRSGTSAKRCIAPPPASGRHRRGNENPPAAVAGQGRAPACSNRSRASRRDGRWRSSSPGDAAAA